MSFGGDGVTPHRRPILPIRNRFPRMPFSRTALAGGH
jgi:hypothetical protein